jgi:fumarate hydratase subunit alpha
MRELQAHKITCAVRDMLLEANFSLGDDLLAELHTARAEEPSPIGKTVLDQIIENNCIAARDQVPVCQDTGMAVFFVRWGQDLRVVDGDFEDAVQAGVRQAYRQGPLRKSIVSDPLFDRKNTGDNTPAVIHVRIVPGEHLHITATPKGFGSENMSALAMLNPASGVAGVKDFVLNTVCKAGPNPCPPIVLGVGIGGTAERVMELAKWATVRPLNRPNSDPRYAALERELLASVNKTGIGPGGLGGKTTALGVHVEFFPTHIAGLPVAVNICCHAARHREVIL